MQLNFKDIDELREAAAIVQAFTNSLYAAKESRGVHFLRDLSDALDVHLDNVEMAAQRVNMIALSLQETIIKLGREAA